MVIVLALERIISYTQEKKREYRLKVLLSVFMVISFRPSIYLGHVLQLSRTAPSVYDLGAVRDKNGGKHARANSLHVR